MIQVIYNGVEITDSVSINKCVHDMYAADRSDMLHIRFNDASGLWNKWQPKADDVIVVKYGAISTGRMFVYELVTDNGFFNIYALSAPKTAFEVTNKAWQRVRFLQIGEEIALRHGLSFASYGVTDQLYNYILQEESDFAFLNKRCILEGCSFLVYNGTLILYQEGYMEAMKPVETITLSEDGEYRFFDRTGNRYNACEIETGIYTGRFVLDDASRIYRPEKVDLSSEEEAERYAENLLKHVNRDLLMGFVKIPILTGYAPASIMMLQNSRIQSWDGKVFLTHVRNDYVKRESKVFFRKITGDDDNGGSV